jgi:short-subunit dehydrogenase
MAHTERVSRGTQFWHDRCTLVTGATGGIGSALARLVARRGGRVGLLGRRTARLADVHARITADGGHAAYAAADITDLDALRDAVARLEQDLGPCQAMVACSGIYRQTHGRRFDPVAANEVIATNVQGVINAFGAVLPGMVDREGGHLAAVSSIAGLVGLPAAGAYAASKAALRILLESLRLDLHSAGIRVTTICPGYVDTPLITDEERATLRHVMTAEQTARRIAKAVERGRAEEWFPWQTWLPAWLASRLPPAALRWVASRLPEMEETDPPP